MYKILDLHNDFFTNKKFSSAKQNYINKAKKNNATICSVLWTSEMQAEKALLNIQNITKLASNNTNTLWCIEDMHFATKPIINQIINCNPAYCSLTWNYDNILAGGALETGDLTEFGKYTIQQLENADIYIDTAHLNERSFMSLANYTTKPMLCTHTACYNIIPHVRNLKDYQLKIIADSGGLIGICMVSEFISGKKTCAISDYVRHIDYAVCKFGINHVAIGTDFYGTKHLPYGITDYKSLQKHLINSLAIIGYKPADINKIFYLNACKYLANKL